MGLKDFFSGITKDKLSEGIKWKVDPSEGIDFNFSKTALKNPEQTARENPVFGLQFFYLKALHEQGLAASNANGFTVLSENVPELESEFFELFGLPNEFDGQFKARFQGNTGQSSFNVNLDLVLKDGTELSVYSLSGPFLKLAEDELYRLSPAQWQLLKALDRHRLLPAGDRGEYENNWLMFQLQLAKQAGVDIDLAHFNKLELIQPEKIGVAVEMLENGDLVLSPTYGADIEIDDINARLGQLGGNQKNSVLRVKDRFVLLDEQRLEATKEILTNRRIPRNQVASFLKSPTAYLNAALIDLDTGFSLRVHGAEKYCHKYFSDIEESGIDWFGHEQALIESISNLPLIIDSTEQLEDAARRINDAQVNKAETVSIEDHQFDISDREQVGKALSLAREKVEQMQVDSDSIDDEFDSSPERLEKAVVAIDGDEDVETFESKAALSGFDPQSQQFSLDNLKRQPFPHQNSGIKWLLEHFSISGSRDNGSGALLADDMGLGKTYMTLVAIGEWYRRIKERGDTQKPVLIVAPLSLLENWEQEVEQTFHKNPFTDLVLLQSDADLKRFKIEGSIRETKQSFDGEQLIEDQDKIRYSLKIGSVYGTDRLDVPGRLVLTTYQTLRDYQFSLCRVDWSVVAFDEAQNLKNPDTLATRSAIGLKADFKLLATGTPVENSLKDFWTLMRCAAPGVLPDWHSFRETYITPIISAEPGDQRAIKMEIGRTLRTLVGEYMLRRTKEDNLEGLPAKTIFCGDQNTSVYQFIPELASVMKGDQLARYDEIVDDIRLSKVEDKRKKVLPGLLKMKVTSIHPDVERKMTIPNNVSDFMKHANRSAKITSFMTLLEMIKARHEKVLVFATTKSIQVYIASLVSSVFKIQVDIVNGETKAVATKKDSMTRKAIIDRFQTNEGFGVIVMSPIAAGVGLTVTGANNVIHLERHWNPAKEAQATDRVYRIGQKRNVNVYIPMALHPTLRSFDLQINSLLSNKIDLSDAVVSGAEVEPEDLMGCFG